MTRRSLMTVALGVGAVTVTGCATRTDTTQEQASVPPRSSPEASSAAPSPTAPVLSREEVVAEYGSRAANSWGIDVPGVAMSLPEGTEPVALTFDCCGGPGGDTLDEALVKALRSSGTAATFFLAGSMGRGESGPHGGTGGRSAVRDRQSRYGPPTTVRVWCICLRHCWHDGRRSRVRRDHGRAEADRRANRDHSHILPIGDRSSG